MPGRTTFVRVVLLVSATIPVPPGALTQVVPGSSHPGAALSSSELVAIVDYLAATEVSQDAWISEMMCPVEHRGIDLGETIAMPRPGVELTSTRSLSAEAAGLTKAEMETLELAWAIVFPGVSGLRAAPAIVGSTVFYSAGATGRLLALDAESGCVKWVYESPTPLRSSVSFEPDGVEGRPTLYFGDARGQVHSVDAASGRPLWIRDARADPGVGMITGSVVVHGGRVIVPISASGVSAAVNPEHECCSGRGAVTVLDAITGERLWTYVTMGEAVYTGEVNSAGARLRGPSGAAIWSTPTVDVERGRIYVTTGQNTSLPATGTSDAIIALDLETGRELWVFQATENDVWNMACSGERGPNCPDPDHSILRDWDFGGAAVLVKLDGRDDVLLAGQKSGQLWALDPDSGSLVWEERVGQGGALGGNHWGIAADGDRVFLPISDPFPPAQEPGMYAFDSGTGRSLWSHRLLPDCSGDTQAFAPRCDTRFGLSATPLVVDGAVISAGVDGRVHIFDGDDGRVLFRFATARSWTGINGVEGNGGAVDAHSIAAGAGLVLIGSGYGSFSQPPGNVLLAFRPRSP
jgi:polyvinyl alcohol dehydrogenase (cytochrome)